MHLKCRDKCGKEMHQGQGHLKVHSIKWNNEGKLTKVSSLYVPKYIYYTYNRSTNMMLYRFYYYNTLLI